MRKNPRPHDLQAPADLVLTGERTLPGIPDENYWFQRHAIAYELVETHAAGATVLDAGCGEGYGLAMLADAGALRVVGVDLDEASVTHAHQAYAARDPRIEVHRAELMDLPLGDDEVDLVVSFQVIEHLHDIPGYLASLRRVCQAGGEVIIATPNRLTFTPDSDTPTNPFHTIEFSPEEFRFELERAGLVVERMIGITHGSAFRLVERLTGATLPQLLLSRDPAQWPGWLRGLVHRATTAWFRMSDKHLDESLDLVALCRNPA